MIRRLTDFVAGLTALITLLALTVGVPAALTLAVGWPLPTTLPNLATIEQSVSSGIDQHVIVKTLALIAWAAWVQIALTVIVETVALARGRTARPLRVMPGLQGSIGRLVTTAALVLTSLLPTGGHIASASAPTSTAAFDAYRAPITLVLPDPTTPPVTAPDEVAVVVEATIAVERHDSYWAIAERVFDDGTRWREIRDHNIGRIMPDGATITADSENLQPGWQLNLPPTATPPPATTAIPAVDTVALETENPVDVRSGIDLSAGDNTVTVETGDNLWTIAEDHLADTLGREATNAETADYWQQLIQANHDRLVTGDPSLIYPGEQFTLPPVPGQPPAIAATDLPAVEQPAVEQPAGEQPAGEQPAAEPPAAEPPAVDPPVVEPATTEPVEQTASTPSADTSPAPPSTWPPPTTLPTETNLPPSAAAADSTSAPTAVATSSVESADRSSMIAGIGLLGIAGTGLGVGILRALRRNRRRHNHLHPDTIPPADIDHTDIQRAAVAAADHDSYTTLTASIDHLARSLPADSTTRPRIVQHGPGHLDVLLTHPTTTAVEGWRPEAGGSIWTRVHPIDRTLDDDLDSEIGWGPAAPLLVSLGRPDDTGDHDTALGVARSFVTELAYSPLAERINLVLVGDLETHAASRLERVATVNDWDDIAGDLTAWAEQSHRIHTERNWPSSFLGRGRHDHDALTPLVIIAATPPDDPDLIALLATLLPAAIAVVSVGPAMTGASVIDCAPDRLTITDLGLTCEPQTITDATVEQITDLLDPADDPRGEPIHITTAPDTEPRTLTAVCVTGTVDSELPEPTPDVLSTAYADPSVDVIVRVLGDIRVDGSTKALTPKQTAVVAYIALQQPVSIDRLEDAVWAAPSNGPRRKRLLNTVSECRGVLGAGNLPAASNDGRYTTAATVITDLELFDRRVNHAANQTTMDAIDTLRGALDLVTGPVFTYRSADRHSFTWVDVENWVSRWEPKIAAVAQHLAQLCLDHHDPTAAIDAANHALRIVPTHTGLTETLMRAHAANADHTSIDAVYRAHTAALEQLDIDDVADSTSELYEQLHRSRIPTGSAAP